LVDAGDALRLERVRIDLDDRPARGARRARASRRRTPSCAAACATFPTMAPTGTRILGLWRRLAPLPGGPWLFSKAFGFIVPYSGSVAPRIRVLEPGHVEVEIADRRSNRNHLGSVHAIALMNIAEITSGLALTATLPPTVRGIVTALSMTYHKKARGTIRAVAHVVVPTVDADRDFDVMAECFDRGGTLVATGHVRWRLGLIRPKAH
jgi:acyl-coenzyme A thioesterase PaaI-like protein